jgi:hypothetical protein
MRRNLRRHPRIYWLKSRPSRLCSTAQIVTRWAARSWRTPSGALNAITRLSVALVVQQRGRHFPNPRIGEIDTLSGPSAARLAQSIRSFWDDAGFDVVVQIIPCSGTGETPVYGVRSDLVIVCQGRPAAMARAKARMTNDGCRRLLRMCNYAI